MYKKLLIFLISFSFLTTSAQIGINTTNIDNGVMLEIDSEDSGVLIPRISLNNINDNTTISGTLTNGTLIYNTTKSATLQEGFYYWQDKQWVLIQSGINENVYTTDGTLNSNRIIKQGTNYLQLEGTAGKKALSLRRTDNNETTGIAFQNSGNSYDAAIYMESPNSTGLVFASGNNDPNIDNLKRTLTLNDNQSITFDAYGNGTFIGAPSQFLTVDTNGNIIEINANTAYKLANSDWFEENTTTPPNSINDNIFTNGNVGIQTNNPKASASLDLGAADQGLLVNRVRLTNASKAGPITNPADGLLVFNTNEDLTAAEYEDHVRKGFYYWDATQSRWIPQKSENRSARFTSDNTIFNLNGAVDKLPIFGFKEWNDDSTLYNVTLGSNSNSLMVNEDGRYHIIVNIPITTTGARTNIDAEIVVNRSGTDEYLGATSSANYIRNANAHNNSTIFIDEIFVLQANDIISINVSGETNIATAVNIRSIGAANFTITKIK